MMHRTLLATALLGLTAVLAPAESLRNLGGPERSDAKPGLAKAPKAAAKSARTARETVAEVFPGLARATAPDLSGPGIGELRPRQVMPKRSSALEARLDPETGQSMATGRILVKFRDDLRFRAPRTPIDRPVSQVDPAAADSIAVMLSRHGGTIEQWINRTPEQLAALEARAAAHSGKMQPDLAGIMAVSFPGRLADADLETFAAELQSMDQVEFVWVELEPRLHQCGPQPETDPPVAPPGTVCNAPSLSCAEAAPTPPWDPAFADNLVACNDVTQLPEDRQGHWGCADNTCCELVTSIAAQCDEEGNGNGWDVYCAALANLLCTATIFDNINPGIPPEERYNPCFTDLDGTSVNPIFAPFLATLSGPCGEPHPGRGCNDGLCCFKVCTLDPTCCTAEWDQNCANLAGQLPDCQLPLTETPTPDFTPQQAYLLQSPAAPTDNWNGFGFYTGQGFDINGLARLQQNLADEYGLYYDTGDELIIPTYGETINVAVIEFSAFVNHEDFVIANPPTTDAEAKDPALWSLLKQPKVIPEPGQTILLIEGANNDPEHGTATLGQIVAAKQQIGEPGTPDFRPEMGARGMSHNAQGWFFPIVSVEEGSRAQNAFVSCFEIFGPGDVTNNSWGFPPDGTIASVEPFSLLVRFGSDLGITTVCSAGNSSVRVNPQPFDTGAIVVGACSPGQIVNGGCLAANACRGFFWRLPFSNFSDPEADVDPQTLHPLGSVDVSAWGSNIFTTGFYPGGGQIGVNEPPVGGVSFERNKLRTYTTTFGGTSGAGPMIAAAVANLQAVSKQIYGGPLAPEQIRSVVSGWGEPQCEIACSPTPENEEDPFPPDCCICGGEDCDSFNEISVCTPFLFDAGIAIFTGGYPDGNRTQIKVITGFPVAGPPSAVFIRAPDRNFLRLGTERGQSGTSVEGLTYLLTGPTTDVYAKLETNLTDPSQIQNIALRVQGRANAPVVIVGGFLFNYRTSRWDFIGVGFYGPETEGQPNVFPIPNYALSDYYGDNGVFKARIWTCSLGLAGPHQVWHDLIQIGVNDPTLVPPKP